MQRKKIIVSSVVIVAFLTTGAYFLNRPSPMSDQRSEQEILLSLAKQIHVENLHTTIDGKKFPIDNEEALMAFKMDVLKDSVVKMALKKTPSLYETTKNLVLAKRPAYLNLEQEGNLSSKVLLGNTLACDVRFEDKASISADGIGQLPCVGLFDNPGGYAADKPVTMYFEKFDETAIDDPLHQKKWDEIIKKEMTKIALKQFVEDYRDNNGKVVL